MLKPLIFAAVVISSVAATAQDLRPAILPANHPLVGVWRVDLPNNCFEQYTLNANGTKLSESGQERNESVFEISEQPSVRGFYMWTDKIIKGNGKPDCGGATTELGHVAVNFVRVHPSRNRFLLCEKEDMNSCYAEFHRVGGGA